MMETERHTMRLADDGTLDTVIECEYCGYVARYVFDGGHEDCTPIANGDCECYGQFVDWALQDAQDEHITAG